MYPITFGTDGHFHVDNTATDNFVVRFTAAQEQTLNTLCSVGAELAWIGRLADRRTHCVRVNWEHFLLSSGGTLTEVEQDWQEQPHIGLTNLHPGNRVQFTLAGNKVHAICVKLWRNGKGADLRVIGTRLTVKRNFDRMDELGTVILAVAPTS